jgi:hypothetical protein
MNGHRAGRKYADVAIWMAGQQTGYGYNRGHSGLRDREECLYSGACWLTYSKTLSMFMMYLGIFVVALRIKF